MSHVTFSSWFSRLALSITSSVFLLAGARPAEAGKAHMGQKPEEHITLVSQASGSPICSLSGNFNLHAVGTDGVPSAEPFLVPEGKRLVVTDVSWVVVQNPLAISAGNILGIEFRTSDLNSATLFRAGQPADANIDAANQWHGEVHMVTGFSIGAGLTLCPRAGTYSSSSGGLLTVYELYVQGYLIKSR